MVVCFCGFVCVHAKGSGDVDLLIPRVCPRISNYIFPMCDRLLLIIKSHYYYSSSSSSRSSSSSNSSSSHSHVVVVVVLSLVIRKR